MSTLGDQSNKRTQMPSMANVKHLQANGGRAFAAFGQTVSFKAEPEDTDDTLLLFEHRIPPTLGVPAHTERNYEAFYVLEGTFEVVADGERYRLGPGEFLSLRPGVVHSLHNPGSALCRVLTLVSPANNPGSALCRVLTLVSPASQHARFFSTMAEPIDDPSNPPAPVEPTDFERIAAIGRECGIEFLPPPEPNDREQA
jgi:quercetin dioxygenase-like cupin family protein